MVFYPCSFCEGQLPLRQLQKMENKMIRDHPDCWNNYRPFNKTKPCIKPSLAKKLPSANLRASAPLPVRLEAYQFCEQTGWVLQCNLALLLTSMVYMVYSLRLSQIPTETFRKFKASSVLAIISPDASDAKFGSLKVCAN